MSIDPLAAGHLPGGLSTAGVPDGLSEQAFRDDPFLRGDLPL